MLKWLLIGVGLLAGLAVAAIVALPRLLDTPAVQAQVAQAASHALGRPVRFASLSVSATAGSVRPTQGSARWPRTRRSARGPFVTVGEGRVRVRAPAAPLRARRARRPDVDGAADRAGRGCRRAPEHREPGRCPRTRRPASPGAAAAGPLPATSAGAVLLSSLRIVDGSVQYQMLGEPTPDALAAADQCHRDPERAGGAAAAVRGRPSPSRAASGFAPRMRGSVRPGPASSATRRSGPPSSMEAVGRGADRRRLRVVPRA